MLCNRCCTLAENVGTAASRWRATVGCVTRWSPRAVDAPRSARSLLRSTVFARRSCVKLVQLCSPSVSYNASRNRTKVARQRLGSGLRESARRRSTHSSRIHPSSVSSCSAVDRDSPNLAGLGITRRPVLRGVVTGKGSDAVRRG